jgi:ferredoxin
VANAALLLLAGAHALRTAGAGEAAAWAALAALALGRAAWARWVVACALALAAIQWIDVTASLVRLRLALHEPWLRLALILGAVLAATLLGLAWTLARGGRRHSRGAPGRAQAASFLLAAALLCVARAKVSFPVLLADRFLPGWGAVEIVALAAWAAWICGLMLDPARAPRVRVRIWGLFSAVFFAQALFGLAGAEELLMTGRLHLPVPALIAAGPVFRGHGLFMPILFGATLLLVGPAWCSHLCYIGAWDDGCARLGGRRPGARPAWPVRWLVAARLGTLALAVGGAALLRAAGASTALAVACGAAFGLAGVAVMLLGSRRAGVMLHCTAYCPMGLLATTLGRVSPWRMRVDEGCTHCGACAGACRYGALGEADLERGRPGPTCTLCGDCVGRCRQGHLRYAFPGLGPDAARATFLAVVAALHAVFLGVARI